MELALEGDEGAKWLLDTAGLDAGSLSGLDGSEQNYRVARGLWEAGRAGFDIVTSTPRAANSNGVNRDFYSGADRALQLLATDFEGIGSLGLVATAAENVPWVGGPIIGTANLGIIQRERAAVDLLTNARLLDRSAAGELQTSLSLAEFSSNMARFTPFGGKLGTAIDIISAAPDILLDLVPEAQGGASLKLTSGRSSAGRAAVRSLDELTLAARESKLYADYVSADYFKLGNKDRGRAIERDILLGRYGSKIDPQNYRTIDYLARGKAASIKSLDLSAVSYADPRRLEAALNRYVNKLKDFSGYSGTMYRGKSPIPMDSSARGAMRQKELVVAVSGQATQTQLEVLASLQRLHNNRNFNLIFYGAK
jgi:hypothetical protein